MRCCPAAWTPPGDRGASARRRSALPTAEWLRGPLAPVLRRQLEAGSIFERAGSTAAAARSLVASTIAGGARPQRRCSGPARPRALGRQALRARCRLSRDCWSLTPDFPPARGGIQVLGTPPGRAASRGSRPGSSRRTRPEPTRVRRAGRASRFGGSQSDRRLGAGRNIPLNADRGRRGAALPARRRAQRPHRHQPGRRADPPVARARRSSSTSTPRRSARSRGSPAFAAGERRR